MTEKKDDADARQTVDLRTFIRTAVVTGPQTVCEQVMALFERHPETECVVVCDGMRKPCGLVMRDKLIRRLGSRFGVSLYSSRPIAELMDERPIVADAAMPLPELLELALGREEATLYDCVIVIEGAELAGVLTVADLLALSKKRERQAVESRLRMISRMARLTADIGAAVDEVREAGRHGDTLSQTMAKLTRQGKEALAEADRRFDALAGRLAAQRERVAGLRSRTEVIDGVTALIRRLAEQCNLLALNASIEASRAGEHGRGFGVVAEEIRKLAAGTQRSAGEIGELVAAVRASVDEMVDAFLTVIRESGESRVAIGRAVEAFERIHAASEDNRATVREINAKAEAASGLVGRVEAEIRGLSDGFSQSRRDCEN